MIEITVIPPTGNAIEDTQNIQRVIDRAIAQTKPVIIELMPEDYHIGYLVNRDTQTEHLGSEWTPSSNFSQQGLILKSIPLSTFQNNEDDAFIEIRAYKNDTHNRPRLVRMEIPKSPILGNAIEDDINRYYLNILKSNMMDVEIPIGNDLLPSSQLARRIEELNREDSDYAKFARRAQGATVGNGRVFNNLTEKNKFISTLLQEETAVTDWLKGLRLFRNHRSISNGINAERYSSDENSALIRMTDINYFGRSKEFAALGWRSDNYQLEQSDGITIYANPNKAGRFRFDATRLSIEESTNDGIHLNVNCEVNLSYISTRNNARGGISVTGQHSLVSLKHCLGHFDSDTVDGISVEVDKNGNSDEFRMSVNRCHARRIKFTLGSKHELKADRILAYGYYSQSGDGANVRIKNSSFVCRYEGDRIPETNMYKEANQLQLQFPGNTVYTDCSFILRKEKATDPMDPNRIRTAPLLNIRTRWRDNGLKNQHLKFVRCKFQSLTGRRSDVQYSAIRRRADQVELNNQVTYEECNFRGIFKSIFVVEGGINRVISSKFNHPAIAQASDYGIFHFQSFFRAGVAFHAELHISGDFRQSELGKRPFIHFDRTSREGVLHCDNVVLNQSQNILFFEEAPINQPQQIIGSRRIETSDTQTDPNSTVDGLLGDILTSPNNSAIYNWRCTQTGDNISIPAKWKRI